MLDDSNLIKEQYFLEVSSPGIERVLRKNKHLKANIGKEININLFKSIDNEKQITGILNKFDESKIYIEKENKIIELDRSNITLIKLKYDW